MNRIRIRIYEKDVDYTEALQEYVQREMGDTVELEAFQGWPEGQGIEEPGEAGPGEYEGSRPKQTVSKIWLVGSSSLTDLGWKELAEIRAAIEKQQEKICWIWLSEGQLLEPFEQEKFILKYQSAEAIIRQALYYWQEQQESQLAWKNVGSDQRIIGVYAPGGHEMQQAFTLILARQLAREAKVLYISLLEYSMLSGQRQEDWQFDLSDLVGMMQRGSGNFREKLESVVQKDQGITFIPPMENPANIHEISSEQYQKLVSSILEETDYQIVVIDYGCIQNGFYELLAKSEKLYCITGNSVIRDQQMQQFLRQVAKYEEACQERIHPVKLEGAKAYSMTEQDPLEELEYGGFGDLVRGELYGRTA